MVEAELGEKQMGEFKKKFRLFWELGGGRRGVGKRDESLADIITYTLLPIGKPGNKGQAFPIISLFSLLFILRFQV